MEQKIIGIAMIVIGLIGFVLSFLIKNEEEWETFYKKNIKNPIYPIGEKRYLQYASAYNRYRNINKRNIKAGIIMIIFTGCILASS